MHSDWSRGFLTITKNQMFPRHIGFAVILCSNKKSTSELIRFLSKSENLHFWGIFEPSWAFLIPQDRHFENSSFVAFLTLCSFNWANSEILHSKRIDGRKNKVKLMGYFRSNKAHKERRYIKKVVKCRKYIPIRFCLF